MLLEIAHQQTEPGTVIISLTGRLMLGKESEQLSSLIEDLLKKGNHRFIFDVAGITRLDSTGIGRFIYSYNRIDQAGGAMAIAAPSEHVRECFRATRLDTVFSFYPDVQAATVAIGTRT